MTDLHRLGHGLSYTDTTFIENKWVEWSKKQSKLVLNNFRAGVLVTHLLMMLTGKTKHLKVELNS